ncbi:hypothetical protein P12x_003069 [Tundrisphaera lichenicola]|uniref:hypothetical protein n=1 Tax=Tundrisphaera lichenicola TaxID=2029860 RepID=UPI003EB6987E
MTTEQYLILGLVAVAAYLHRERLRALLLGTAPLPPIQQAPALRVVETVAPSTAQLIGLVHHQTEAEALERAQATAAETIVRNKAAQKFAGLPLVMATTPQAPSSPSPPKA